MVSPTSFSPDGRRVLTASGDRTAKIWDAETGQELLTLKSQSAIRSVAFSPDGKRIVSGSTDKTLKIWDAELGWMALVGGVRCFLVIKRLMP